MLQIFGKVDRPTSAISRLGLVMQFNDRTWVTLPFLEPDEGSRPGPRPSYGQQRFVTEAQGVSVSDRHLVE